MANIATEITSRSDTRTLGGLASNGREIESASELVRKFAELKRKVSKVIVGQEAVIDQLMIALLARGHCLLVGVPGLAKTLLIRTLSDVLHLTFSRIQFTPDLMPTD